MDSVAMVASRASTEALKEPRGFIKFIQIGLAIFAFATTTAYVGSTQFKVECNSAAPRLVDITFSYPYQLDQVSIPTNSCSNSSNLKPIYGNYKAASEFYVFVGVTAFLYSLGILIFYVFADDLYHSKDIVPMIDFVVTAVYVALWLIASAAWADGVQKIKHYTKPDILWNHDYVCECKLPSSADCQEAETCSTTNGGNYATLNVSIIFGFLCMAVWAGNLWFLYKETKWFKPPAGDTEGVTTSQASSPGGI